MYRYLVVILLFVHFPQVTTECPRECECRKQVDSTYSVTCTTDDPVGTIQSLPASVSHLRLLLGSNLGRDQLVSVNNLVDLRSLTIDYAPTTLTGSTIIIDSSAFCNNSKLEIFRSRVRTQWNGNEQFIHNTNLREVMISHSRMYWNYMSGLVNTSLVNKANLTTLRMRYFTEMRDPSTTDYFSLKTIFGALGNITIKQLDLASNGLHFIAPDWFVVFLNLEYLDISYNMLCYYPDDVKPATELIMATLMLPNLRYVDFGNQGKYEAYTSQNEIDNINMKQPTFESKTEEVLDDKNISIPCECGPIAIPLGRVEVLLASQILPKTYPKAVTSQTFKCICFANNHLKHLDFSENALTFEEIGDLDDALFINLNALHIINLQNCQIKRLSKQFFSVIPRLQFAYLSGNKLGTALDEGTNFYFFNNYWLQVLDLANNYIEKFPKDNVLTNLGKLTHLNLSDNQLSSWNTDISHLSHLVIFNLSGNNFNNLSEFLCDQLDKLAANQEHFSGARSVVTVDLSRNPLSCLCGNLQFVSWIQTTKVNFFHKDDYTCIHPEFNEMNLLSVDLHELKKYCSPNLWTTIAIAVSVSTICTLVIVAVFTLYCKRWHLRYWWYLLHKGWHRLQDEQDESDYQYDVFVAHNTEDAEWVTGPLFDELETKRGLRLCLYQRDILPHEVLVQAIVEKISMSRRTLLVLSPNFVASNWCYFELHIAHTKLCEEGKDVIVSVILKELPAVAINETLYKLLKRKVYLEWPSEEEGQALFWDKLASALTPPVGACGHSTPS